MGVLFLMSEVPLYRILSAVDGVSRSRWPLKEWGFPGESYLTQSVSKSFGKSQFPYKSVNLSCILVTVKDKIHRILRWMAFPRPDGLRKNGVHPVSLTHSVFKVVLHKSIRQLILYISDS